MQKSDVNSFLKQLNLNPDREFTYPCDNVTIIKRALRNLMSAYEEHESSNKQQEIKEAFPVACLNCMLENISFTSI
jgi:antitoxin component of MazEF toxin-antitoxin module